MSKRLWIALALVAPAVGVAAPTFVSGQQVNNITTGTSHQLSLPLNVTAGSAVLVFVRNDTDTDNVTGATTDFGATCTQVGEVGNAAIRGYAFSCEGSTGGGATITVTSSASTTLIWGAVEYSSVKAGGALEVSTSVASFGSTNSPLTGNVTTTVNDGRMVCGVLPNSDATTITPAGGESERFEYTTHRLQVQDEAAVTAGTFNCSWTFGTSRAGIYMAFALIGPSTPTFTSAPAIGTRTTSSIPINFTTDLDATVYSVRCPDGQTAPTVAQVKAGNCTGDIAAIQSWSEATLATIADSHTFGSITDGTVSDGSFVASGAGGDSAVASIADLYKKAALDTAQSVTSQTAVAYTVGYSLDGAGNYFAVACKKDQTAPTVAQVLAGNCTGDVAAVASANEATSGAADSIVLGSALTLPVHDLYGVGTYGSQPSDLESDLDECLDAPSGKQVINCPNGLTSIGVGSAIEALNAVISPDIAVGDIPTVDLVTTPEGCAVTMSVAGYLSVGESAPTIPCSGTRQYINATFYDLSVGAAHADDLDWWLNDPEILVPDPDSLSYYVPLNSPMTPVDLSTLCAHPLGDAITVTNVDALPTGLSVVANSLQGTATVRGKTTDIAFACTSDVTGQSVTWQ